MKLFTECYIRKNGRTLMMYRNKMKNDINQGRWIGLGGKFEPGESPEQCLLREVEEEAGVILTDFRLRGLLTFITTDGSSEPLYLFIYTASDYDGEIGECDEGTLSWIDDKKIRELDLWEGDRLFWDWLDKDERFFSARFVYHEDVLTEHQVSFYA